MISTLTLDKANIGNLKAIKREFTLLATGVILSQLDGGSRF